MPQLIDLGEREILRSIIPKFAQGAGDDCALVELPAGTLVVTTDPVPPPAAASIGRDDDLFWMGWLLVTINVSDLAAAGAAPLGFLAAVEAEQTREVAQFERLLEGIRAGCEAARIAYIGGNIREAQRLTAVGTAVGICHDYKPLKRTGAQRGDLVLSIGKGGVFWRDALRLIDQRGAVHKDESPVYKPSSQINVMQHLVRAGLVKAAMDNSDGLLPTLNEMSAKNEVGIEVDTNLLVVPGLMDSEVADQARLWLGWGDWNVIACVTPEHETDVIEIAQNAGGVAVRIGRLNAPQVGVTLRNGNHTIAAPRLESERFAKDSWMLKGIDEYVRMLRSVQMP
jgi:thiamine-monophosphate kinase